MENIDVHPYQKALIDLSEASKLMIPPHSGACIDYAQKHWPVTDESCRCEEHVKKFRKAARHAMATLEYAPPPALPSTMEMRLNETHERYVVLLRGGTVIKLPGGKRGQGCKYDTLLSLLDDCSVLDIKGINSSWSDGKRAIIASCMESSNLLGELLNQAIKHG